MITEILNILQTLTGLALTGLVWRMIARKKNGAFVLPLAFFAFAMVTLATSDLYWLAFTILRPETRMPFSATEIGECGVFLLLSASLSAALPKDLSRRALSPATLLPALLFSACNTALWIGWNGSYLTNVLTGLALWALLAVCLSALVQTAALGKAGMTILGVWAFGLTVLQGSTFLAPENIRAITDAVCYVLIFAGYALLTVWILRGVICREPANRLLALTFSQTCLSLYALYMSADPMYSVVFFLMTVCIVFCFLALRRAAKEAECPEEGGVCR